MKPTFIAVLVFACLTAFKTATATTIDFEAQGTSAPSVFDSKLNSPLTIGIATFTGGELLKNETGSIDTTVVYATNGYLAGYADPLVITFSQPVSNASLLLTNETRDTYTLTDNLGGASSVAIGSTNVNQLLSLSDVGITRLTLSTAATVNWDFAIDNVSFTVPEIDANSAAGAVALLAGSLLIFRGKRKIA